MDASLLETSVDNAARVGVVVVGWGYDARRKTSDATVADSLPGYLIYKYCSLK
jgi:hypothetical protein